jgi:hypothetical protein
MSPPLPTMQNPATSPSTTTNHLPNHHQPNDNPAPAPTPASHCSQGGSQVLTALSPHHTDEHQLGEGRLEEQMTTQQHPTTCKTQHLPPLLWATARRVDRRCYWPRHHTTNGAPPMTNERDHNEHTWGDNPWRMKGDHPQWMRGTAMNKRWGDNRQWMNGGPPQWTNSMHDKRGGLWQTNEGTTTDEQMSVYNPQQMKGGPPQWTKGAMNEWWGTTSLPLNETPNNDNHPPPLLRAPAHGVGWVLTLISLAAATPPRQPITTEWPSTCPPPHKPLLMGWITGANGHDTNNEQGGPHTTNEGEYDERRRGDNQQWMKGGPTRWTNGATNEWRGTTYD